jgi:hypothetical protein
MDEHTRARWGKALEMLGKCPPEQRNHFANLLIQLVSCYDLDSDARAIVLISDGDNMFTYSAGADETEAKEIIACGYHALCGDAATVFPPLGTLQ